MQTLPKMPTQLIRLALNDLKLVENDPNYRVDMAHYHARWHDTGPCYVCLAGSVMAKSLNAAKRDLTTHDMGFENGPLLRALNQFRLGHVDAAFAWMERNSGSKYNRDIVPYAEDRVLFFTQMECLANDLEKDGF